MRTCSKCLKPKSESDFHMTSRDGLKKQCKECCQRYNREFHANNKEERNASQRKYRQEYPEILAKVQRKSHLKNAYGLSPEAHSQLLIDQNNCCAICGDEFIKTPDVDHIHETNPPVVRGLLCRPCNRGLGLYRDSIERLEKAINYLRRTS